MKVIIHGRKSLKESKKRNLRESRQVLREFEPITLALGAIIGSLTTLLAVLFPKLKALFGGMGEKMKEAGDDAEKAGDKMSPQAKEDFMAAYNAANKDLQDTIDRLKKEQEAGGSTKGATRPSAQIAVKVVALIKVVEETKTKNAEELKTKPDAVKELDSCKAKLKELSVDLQGLDFTAAISSKEDPKGLWKSVEKVPGVQQAFAGDKEWLGFAQAYARNVDDASKQKFKVTELPTG